MKLKDYIEAKDISVAKMARKLGISPTYLAAIVREIRYPSLEMAYKIEEYTKGQVKMQDLVKYKSKQEKEK